MGTIISFRYTKPTSSPAKPYQISTFGAGQYIGNVSAPRTILVLHPEWIGYHDRFPCLHGLKISGLTPIEQEMLQRMFNSIYTNQEDFFEPLLASIESRKEQVKILNQQRADLLRKQQGVVVRPQRGMGAGMIQKGRAILGAVVGKIKTFGRSPTEQVFMTQDPMIAQEVTANEQATSVHIAELSRQMEFLRAQKTQHALIGRIPRDPYNMYHSVIKPMIGRVRMPNIYRKFDVQYVSTPRIIKSPGVVYAI